MNRILFTVPIFAKPAHQLVQVVVSPNIADWTYDIDDRAEFTIQVLRNNKPLEGVEVKYSIQPEQMKPIEEGTLTLKKGNASVKAPKLKEAGFLRCYVPAPGVRPYYGDVADAVPQHVHQQTRKSGTSKYFDVVNFARFVKVPGWYSWEYNDNVCPPTSMYAAYNVIPGKKELHVYPETQHWYFPEQDELRSQWLYKMLMK